MLLTKTYTALFHLHKYVRRAGICLGSIWSKENQRYDDMEGEGNLIYITCSRGTNLGYNCGLLFHYSPPSHDPTHLLRVINQLSLGLDTPHSSPPAFPLQNSPIISSLFTIAR